MATDPEGEPEAHGEEEESGDREDETEMHVGHGNGR
jgi:hypothetical protein